MKIHYKLKFEQQDASPLERVAAAIELFTRHFTSATLIEPRRRRSEIRHASRFTNL